MNTQAKVQSLAAGQALAMPRRGAASAVLTRGEVLVQEPATWLGGTVVVPRAVRLVAPAVLPAMPSGSVVAMRASTVVVQEPAAPLSLADWRAIAVWMRRLWRGGGFHAGRKAQGHGAG